MLQQTFIKKALFKSAFFVSVIYSLILTSVALADGCKVDVLSPAEPAKVKWVYDGDTLLLTDKRKIRIIGIDTPEVAHHKQKKQAYSGKAREALRELLNKYQYKVLLRYGDDKKDRYSRILAHVFTPDGINISTWLLEKGFASTLVFPPNIKLADCYKKSELQAQEKSLGIWTLKRNQIKLADKLSRRIKGRIRLKGKVKKIKRHKKSIVMELDSTSKSHIQIKIKKKNFSYFKKLNMNKLWDKTIIISGYLKNKRNKRTMSLKHPSQLRLVQQKSHISIINWSLKDAN